MKLNITNVTSPIDIFEVNLFNNFYFSSPFFLMSNFTIISLIIISFVALFLHINNIHQSPKIKHNVVTVTYSFLSSFIKNLLLNTTHSRQHIHYPILCLITLIIFITNLFGVLPYGLSLTSHICLTFSLSFIFFIGFNIICLIKHKTNMVKLWLPNGTPILIIPFIIVIEILSYITRVFSLAIRLFANMMAGHTLIKILTSFAWLLFISGGIMAYFSIFPLILIFLILGLEIAIAILQAYVFIVLITIYLGDTILLH